MSTPLRYPGGKQKIWRAVADIIISNGLEGCEYVEPFAGGAGIAIELLNNGIVNKIHINDVNPIIRNFWRCVVTCPDEMCAKLACTPVTVKEWDKQKAILRSDSCSSLEKAFAFLFVNRTSFSGIINGGIIGGRKQQGQYKIDSRYPRERLIRDIETLAAVRSKIKVTGIDAGKFLQSVDKRIKNAFIYCDPPYYVKGRQLYLDYYQHDDHVKIAEILSTINSPWIVTYDNVIEIRRIYRKYKKIPFSMQYCARFHEVGKEILICSDNVKIKK